MLPQSLSSEVIGQPICAVLQCAYDSSDGVVVGRVDPSLPPGPLVELSKRVGQERQGITAYRLLGHSFNKARCELETGALGGTLDDFGQPGTAQGLHNHGLVDRLGETSSLRCSAQELRAHGRHCPYRAVFAHGAVQQPEELMLLADPSECYQLLSLVDNHQNVL